MPSATAEFYTLLRRKINDDYTYFLNTAYIHLAPNRQPRQHPTTVFFTGQMPFLLPNQQRQSTEGLLWLTAARNTLSAEFHPC